MLRVSVLVVAIVAVAGSVSAQGAGRDGREPRSASGVRSEAGGPGVAGSGQRRETPAEAARRAVLDELERLRGEIAMLKALREAQEALVAWNGLRVRAGESPAGLDDALCAKVGPWCEALPGSFGRVAREGSR